MFNEIHELQELRWGLDKFNTGLLIKAESNSELSELLEEASSLLNELHSIYGECADIVEEE
jgi:hypothetical protein